MPQKPVVLPLSGDYRQAKKNFTLYYSVQIRYILSYKKVFTQYVRAKTDGGYRAMYEIKKNDYNTVRFLPEYNSGFGNDILQR